MERAERDAEKEYVSKKEMLKRQQFEQLKIKNNAFERINNKYHWEQARKLLKRLEKSKKKGYAQAQRELQKQLEREKGKEERYGSKIK